MSMMRPEQEEALKGALLRCILLKDEDKRFWLENLATLPDVLLVRVLGIVEKENARVDEYVAVALDGDKDHQYLAELKAKIAAIKKKAFSMEQETESGSAEDVLKKELGNL